MCQERKRTRDRLLEYDLDINILRPHTAGLPMIYPWERQELSILSHQIYQIGVLNGYSGTEDDFWQDFLMGSEVVFDTYENFPIPGEDKTLYLDRSSDTLYYFKETQEAINESAAEEAGAIIVGGDGNVTYLYIPVRAILIENTILNCGTGID